MWPIGSLVFVVFVSLHTIVYGCNPDPHQGTLVTAPGSYLADSSDHGTNWAPGDVKCQMNFDQQTCQYEKIVLGLPKNTDYAWKVAFNGRWGGDKGCNGGQNCPFNSNTSGNVLLIYNPYNDQLSSIPLGDNITTTTARPTTTTTPGQTTTTTTAQTTGTTAPGHCGDGKCLPPETHATCPQDCPNDLPGCQVFPAEACLSGDQFHANPGVDAKRWQSPKPGTGWYQPSYQHYYTLVGYADIIYTDTTRQSASVCLRAIHKNDTQVTFTYVFDNTTQTNSCKTYTSAYTGILQAKILASDNTSLVLPEVDFAWNAKPLASRPGDYRNGQKGGVAEMFGWPHNDIRDECEFLAKAGYLGVKIFPVHEQLMSTQPMENAMNPWYFMYQPVSYRLDGRMGTREELRDLIQTCRGFGVRVYIDAVLNHFTGAGNDMYLHRNPNGCVLWGNKTSSAPIDRQSPFYTHAYTYQDNRNTGIDPSNEYPAAAIGTDDFHCDRALNTWTDLFILNNGWLVGLTDLDTSKDNVRERQAAYLVDMLSLGASGFRFDASKHISPQDLSGILKKVQTKMGGQLPDDFFVWLEVLTGGEADLIWQGPSWYGTMFENILKQDLGSDSEVDKVKVRKQKQIKRISSSYFDFKMWDGLYPKEPQNNPLISRHRVVIQNDDHDQQSPGSSSRDMGDDGCVLVKGCPVAEHRAFEVELFQNPKGVTDNDHDWPIRFVLSSFYHTQGNLGIPDGKSSCSMCTVECSTCTESWDYKKAHDPSACGYAGTDYTRTHRDVSIINAMRSWMKLPAVTPADLGIPNCS